MALTPASFLSDTLKRHKWGDLVTRILFQTLTAVQPDKILRKSLKRTDTRLQVTNIEIDLSAFQRIFIIGIGKASLLMTATAVDILDEFSPHSTVVTKNPPDDKDIFIDKLHVSGHPIPSQESLNAAEDILNTLSDLSPNDLVLVLLSGGGSSLLALPAEGISLDDLQRLNNTLLSCGASIEEINTIRKHVSRVKGGLLSQAAFPAKMVAMILSDVMGNSLDMVASGPTCPDPTTFDEAYQIVQKYQLRDSIPESVWLRIHNGVDGKIDETPKPGDEVFNRVTNLLVGSNRDALEAAVQTAKIEGLNTDILPYTLEGEAKLMGEKLANSLVQLAKDEIPLPRPALLVTGGETIVQLPEKAISGAGGRNLETALSAIPILDGIKDSILITMASDGEDGLTGAAGGVVTGESYQRAIEQNLNLPRELENHNSYRVFDKLDDLIAPGPTGTNVNDLCFLFTF